MEETILESYETLLDKDDCTVDEYQIFKNLIESKSHKNVFLSRQWDIP